MTDFNCSTLTPDQERAAYLLTDVRWATGHDEPLDIDVSEQEVVARGGRPTFTVPHGRFLLVYLTVKPKRRRQGLCHFERARPDLVCAVH